MASDTYKVALDESDQLGESGDVFCEIGLESRAGWITSAVLYGTGGLIGLVLNLAVPGIDWAWQALATAYVALFASPLFYLASTRLAPAGISAYFRMTFGLVLISWLMWFVGDMRGAIWPFLLFTILAPAYLHREREAYACALISIVVAAAALIVSSETPTRVIVGIVVLSTLAVGIIKQQQGVRKLAILNRRLSLIDPLTGIANMRLLRQRLQAMIDRTGNDAHHISVLAIDLDKFKLVNDCHSHTVGDTMIREVAQAILRTVRECDLVARRGGDEFYVVLDRSTNESSAQLVGRLQQAVAAARLQICDGLPSSVSIGLAELNRGESVDSLLARADDALHCAKQASTVGERRLTARNESPSRPETPTLTCEAGHASARHDGMIRIETSKWTWAAAVYSLCAALCFALVIGGLAPDLAGPVQISLLAGLSGVALWCFGQGRSGTGTGGLRIANLLGLVLISAFIFSAGSAGPDFADVLMLPIIYQFIFERRAVAMAWLVVIGSVFAVVLVTAEYQYTTARVVITIFVLLAAGMRVAGTRNVVESFIAKSASAAELDPLTGIANVRGLRKLIDKAVNGRTDKLLVLFAVDLDDFKQVNDLHSHQLGDVTLTATGRAIERAIGARGSAARRGGDEFSAICEVASFADAANMAVSISEQIEAARSAICTDVLPTASVAFISWHEGESASEFLVRADDELHRTKAAAHERRAADRVRHGSIAS